MAAEWQACAERLAQDPAAARTFLPDGKAPVMGEMFAEPAARRQPGAHRRARARTAFYTGALAQAIAADLQARGGLLTARRPGGAHRRLGGHDQHDAIVATTSTSCRPAPRAFVALEMLNILEGFDIAAMGHNSADYLHVVAEAKKIAFADRGAYLADRAFVPPTTCWRRCCRRSTRRRRRARTSTWPGPGAIAAGGARAVGAVGRAANSPAAIAATPSTSPPPTARATSSRSSSRCSAASAPASSPATPASPCTTAARASRSRRGIPTRSARASGRCTRWCRR